LGRGKKNIVRKRGNRKESIGGVILGFQGKKRGKWLLSRGVMARSRKRWFAEEEDRLE